MAAFPRSPKLGDWAQRCAQAFSERPPHLGIGWSGPAFAGRRRALGLAVRDGKIRGVGSDCWLWVT